MTTQIHACRHPSFCLSALHVLLLSGPVAVSALQGVLPSVPSAVNVKGTTRLYQAQQQYPAEFHRAVECAKHQGLCNVDELLELADELEHYEGSCMLWQVDMDEDPDEIYMKNGILPVYGEDDCEKEILDRLDIADLLRAEGEMVQRRDNLEHFSNAFTEKVEQQKQKP